MKLAFIVSGKSPTTMTGGLGSYSYSVAKSLSQLGYQVFIIGVSDTDETVRGDFCDFVHVKTSLRKLASVSAFLMMGKLVKRILRLIGEHDAPEVLIYGAGIWGRVGNLVKEANPNPAVSVHAVAAYFTTFRHEYTGQKLGCPAGDYGIAKAWSLSLLCRVIDVFYVPLEHATLRQLDRIVVHYRSTQNILLEEVTGLDPSKIEAIPYYVDLYERKGDRKEVEARGESKRICCVCRQDPRKGINTLLHAIKVLKDRGLVFECVIAGNGPFRKSNVELAGRLKVDDVVTFPGFVSSVEDMLTMADIYVFPSVEEGSGAISLLEAMLTGLPIVTTRCDGIPEDFEDGVNGLLVPPMDHVALAEAIERLLRDEELAKTLGGNVLVDYKRRFTRTGMTEGIARILEILESNGKKTRQVTALEEH